MSQTHDPNAGYEPDVQSSSMVTIGIYFVVLTTLFFGCLGALFMYFRWEADQELERKVATLENKALKDLHANEEAVLAGKKLDGQGAATAIDASMKKAVADLATLRKAN
jgi:CBS domain containing-hemolysin-like protein